MVYRTAINARAMECSSFDFYEVLNRIRLKWRYSRLLTIEPEGRFEGSSKDLCLGACKYHTCRVNINFGYFAVIEFPSFSQNVFYDYFVLLHLRIDNIFEHQFPIEDHVEFAHQRSTKPSRSQVHY